MSEPAVSPRLDGRAMQASRRAVDNLLAQVVSARRQLANVRRTLDELDGMDAGADLDLRLTVARALGIVDAKADQLEAVTRLLAGQPPTPQPPVWVCTSGWSVSHARLRRLDTTTACGERIRAAVQEGPGTRRCKRCERKVENSHD